jgi:dedicator of cytokinesis protein 3
MVVFSLDLEYVVLPLEKYSFNRHLAQGYQTGLIVLVDQVLTLCLSHHDQLRTNAVQIIYSMVLSEYQQTSDFAKMKTEVINKLDELFVSENKADDVSRAFFIKQLRELFESSIVHEDLRTRMLEFLASVDMFLELLISVRELPEGDEFLDDKVIATLRLMNFTREIGRDEMYIKYVHQLANVRHAVYAPLPDCADVPSGPYPEPSFRRSRTHSEITCRSS